MPTARTINSSSIATRCCVYIRGQTGGVQARRVSRPCSHTCGSIQMNMLLVLLKYLSETREPWVLQFINEVVIAKWHYVNVYFIILAIRNRYTKQDDSFKSVKRSQFFVKKCKISTGFPHFLENLEKNSYFPGPWNVLEICKIKKCPGKNIACENIHLEEKSPWMSVEENFNCRRKRVPVHSLDIPC